MEMPYRPHALKAGQRLPPFARLQRERPFSNTKRPPRHTTANGRVDSRRLSIFSICFASLGLGLPLGPAPARSASESPTARLSSGMNDFLKQSIARVTGILRKSPGALGEPTGFLPTVEEQAPAVSWGEIYEQIEREVVLHWGNLEAADPVEMPSWAQFIAMLFCQLGDAQSLRDIVRASLPPKANCGISGSTTRPGTPRSPTPNSTGPQPCIRISFIGSPTNCEATCRAIVSHSSTSWRVWIPCRDQGVMLRRRRQSA